MEYRFGGPNYLGLLTELKNYTSSMINVFMIDAPSSQRISCYVKWEPTQRD